jgi:hypothetical protein
MLLSKGAAELYLSKDIVNMEISSPVRRRLNPWLPLTFFLLTTRNLMHNSFAFFGTLNPVLHDPFASGSFSIAQKLL